MLLLLALFMDWTLPDPDCMLFPDSPRRMAVDISFKDRAP